MQKINFSDVNYTFNRNERLPGCVLKNIIFFVSFCFCDLLNSIKLISRPCMVIALFLRH